MSTQRAEIRKARPHLYAIAPLTFWVLCCFVILNLWLSINFIIATHPSIPPIENNVMNDTFWAGIFGLMAISLAWGIFVKNWNLARYSMMFGLFIKSIFLYALISIGLHSGFKGLFGVLGLWIFAVGIQLGAVIYFNPPRTPEISGMRANNGK